MYFLQYVLSMLMCALVFRVQPRFWKNQLSRLYLMLQLLFTSSAWQPMPYSHQGFTMMQATQMHMGFQLDPIYYLLQLLWASQIQQEVNLPSKQQNQEVGMHLNLCYKDLCRFRFLDPMSRSTIFLCGLYCRHKGTTASKQIQRFWGQLPSFQQSH